MSGKFSAVKVSYRRVSVTNVIDCHQFWDFAYAQNESVIVVFLETTSLNIGEVHTPNKLVLMIGTLNMLDTLKPTDLTGHTSTNSFAGMSKIRNQVLASAMATDSLMLYHQHPLY